MPVARLLQCFCCLRAQLAFTVYHTSRGCTSYRPRYILSTQSFFIKSFSSQPPRKEILLSDVEDYVTRDFTLSDLQRKLDEENLPAPVTTASLLKECKTLKDVLKELEMAVIAEKLWKDELVLYFRALLARRSEIFHKRIDGQVLEHSDDQAIILSPVRLLHDNPYFQFLLKETLVHSPRLTTAELSFVFHAFAALRIPHYSSSMMLLVAVLQNRINELFPSDVLYCFGAIRRLKRTKLTSSLRQGLLLHLENQIVDVPAFTHIWKSTPLVHRLQLLNYISNTGSSNLKSNIYYSIIQTIKARNPGGLQSTHEAESVIKQQSREKFFNPFLLKAAVKFFVENQQSFLPRHRYLLNLVERHAELCGVKIPTNLLVDSEGDYQEHHDEDEAQI